MPRLGAQTLRREQSALLCSICADRPHDALLLPCKHQNVCMQCAKSCQSCPFCRVKITGRELLTPAAAVPLVCTYTHTYAFSLSPHHLLRHTGMHTHTQPQALSCALADSRKQKSCKRVSFRQMRLGAKLLLIRTDTRFTFAHTLTHTHTITFLFVC